MANNFAIAPASGLETEVLPVRGRLVKSKWARNLLTFLMVLGPGLIVRVADNDAGAGIAGAEKLQKLLPCMSAILMPFTKDIRDMVRAGLTKPTLDAMVNDLMWSKPGKGNEVFDECFG